MLNSREGGMHPAKQEAKSDREKLLSKKDILVVERGLARLAEHLLHSSVESLPNILIFPEIAARPLVYAVKPVIEYVCKLRNISSPLYRFVATHRHATAAQEKRLILSSLRDELLTTSDQAKSSELTEDISFETNAFKNAYYLSEFGTEGEWAETAEHNVRERLNDIITENHSNTLSLLIIDDYVDRGGSFMQLNELLESEIIPYEEDRTITAAYFTFFQNIDPIKQTKLPENTFAGSTTRDAGFSDYHGFTYRNDALVFSPEKKQEQRQKKEGVIGVRKNPRELLSQRADTADRSSMKLLRTMLADAATRVMHQLQQK